jgi:cysteine desulfurase
VQALGKIPTAHWNRADFISISAHKIYGPKGVGALIVGSNAKLVPLNYGGSQELKRRGGTQATPAIFGFAGACEELSSPEDLCALAGLRDRFEHLLETELTDLSIQGKGEPRIPNTSNIRFTGVSAEALLGALDLEGIHVSTGSACSSGSVLPSPVLMAMGLNESEAKECLRISWGRSTISSDIDTAAEAVVRHVQRIRARKPRSI